ncbi:MAG: hypothetical protein R3C56_03485 [Pirellulaceae bacterium]
MHDGQVSMARRENPIHLGILSKCQATPAFKVTPAAPNHKTQHPPPAPQSRGLDDPSALTINGIVAIGVLGSWEQIALRAGEKNH